MVALGAFLFSYFLAYGGTWLLLRLRLNRSFIDVPTERGSHEVPKPRFGGVAIVGAFFIVFLFLAFNGPLGMFVPFAIGGLVLFAAGVVDDRRSLPVSVRFLAQAAAALVVIGFGHAVHHVYLPLVGTLDLGVVAVPLTFLFVMASINFYNFIDGIDGLAAGSAFLASGFLALIAFMLGHVPLALVCLAAAGSAGGFLKFNFPPSKLFMGDSGSTFFGFFFAYVAVVGNGLEPALPFFIPVLILSSLYLDAGLTLVRRAFRGEKIFQAHHTHYYQRLLSLGFNHKQVTALEYALTALLGVSAVIFFKAGGFFPVFLCLCWVAVFTAFILKIRSLERGDRLFWERRTVLVIGGDLLLITASYVGAYFLRMGFRFTEAEGMAMLRAYPIVLVVRSACFYWYGLYRGMWKYTSTPDVVRIIKAVTTGSAIILAVLVLFYRFVAFPRSLFVIEYFLLIAAIGGTRFASRLFHEFGKEALGANVRRVGIIGAGDFGERLAREIRSAEGRSVSIVSYIDDDEDKIGLTVQGIPVDGPIERLGEIVRRRDIGALILGISKISDGKLKSIIRLARGAGVPLEGREGIYAPKREPAPVLFDRIGRAFGRTTSYNVQSSTESYYAGKRVLVTHGGECIGPGLVRELISLGADVTVHVGSPWELSRFGVSRAGAASPSFIIGALDREMDALRVLDRSTPDVVLHSVAYRSVSTLNAKDYLWRKTIRTTDALCKALSRHSVDSFGFLEFWGGVHGNEYPAHFAAVSEAIALNAPSLSGTGPKVVRLPGVLSAEELGRFLDAGDAEDSGGEIDRYALLEVEAITFLLDAAAGYKKRVVLVPKNEGLISRADIVNSLKSGGPSAPSFQPEAVRGEREWPMFPNEAAAASLLVGAREVVTPLYPANEELMDCVARCAVSSRPEDIEGALQWLRVHLYERASGEIPSPIE